MRPARCRGCDAGDDKRRTDDHSERNPETDSLLHTSSLGCSTMQGRSIRLRGVTSNLVRSATHLDDVICQLDEHRIVRRGHNGEPAIVRCGGQQASDLASVHLVEPGGRLVHEQE